MESGGGSSYVPMGVFGIISGWRICFGVFFTRLEGLFCVKRFFSVVVNNIGFLITRVPDCSVVQEALAPVKGEGW